MGDMEDLHYGDVDLDGASASGRSLAQFGSRRNRYNCYGDYYEGNCNNRSSGGLAGGVIAAISLGAFLLFFVCPLLLCLYFFCGICRNKRKKPVQQQTQMHHQAHPPVGSAITGDPITVDGYPVGGAPAAQNGAPYPPAGHTGGGVKVGAGNEGYGHHGAGSQPAQPPPGYPAAAI